MGAIPLRRTRTRRAKPRVPVTKMHFGAEELTGLQASGRWPDRASSERTCVVFITGALGSLSGGDLHAIRFAEHWGRTRGPAYVLGPPSLKLAMGSPVPACLLSPSVPLEGLLSGRLLLYPLLLLLRAVRYARCAPKANVHVAASHFIGDVLACRLVRPRTTMVVYVHHLVAGSQRKPSLRSAVSVGLEKLSLRLARRARVIFTGSSGAQAALLSSGFRASKLILTANGCDAPAQLPPRQCGQGRVIYLGRLAEEKGVWDFLHLADVVGAEDPRLSFEVIGDGPARRRLQQISRQSNARFVLHGAVSDEQKWRLLRSADLVVCPSREEGWGIAVREALFAGLPVVAYDLPAYEDLSGYVHLVPLGDRDRLCDTTRQVLLGNLIAGPVLEPERVFLSWGDVVEAEARQVQRLAELPLAQNRTL